LGNLTIFFLLRVEGVEKSMDETGAKILREIVRNPKISNMNIARNTGLTLNSVTLKRTKMEHDGLIQYFARVNQHEDGTKRFLSKHLYTVRLKLGHSANELFDRMLQSGVNHKPSYIEHISDSYLAEVEGHASIIMVLEGRDDEEIAQFFNSSVLADLTSQGGADIVHDVKTLRVTHRIRIFHNYLPHENMQEGKIKKEWEDDLIFVD
jgi:DNA-binding Lrp family transcriptional regulator